MISKILFLLILSFSLIISSCGSFVTKIFSKRTPHEVYADKVEDTPEGRQWLAASTNVLTTPHTISLPYRQIGVFPAGTRRALALKFTVRRGERINFDLAKKNNSAFTLYADVYRSEGTEPSHLLAADTASTEFGFDADEPGTYILRLQPELFSSGEYDLAISVVPSLSFPVAGNKARAGSFWGADRGAGKRTHEGVDIFAPKKTPVVAAADGYITKVDNGGIGGKTVWMRVIGKNISLYYAHLDQQLVESGQTVMKGDTLGLVGNTGNAEHTPSHLHFGIYTYGGAVDPWPFINHNVKAVPTVASKNLEGYLQPKKITKGKKPNDLSTETKMVPLAITHNGYVAELPDGKIVETPFESVKMVK